MMRFAQEIASSQDFPILDVPCGFGRNALALAVEGSSIIGLNKSLAGLQSLVTSAAKLRTPAGSPLCILPVCADLSHEALPFAQSSFSAIMCIHYPVQQIIEFLKLLLRTGGHLYIETFGGHGENNLQLPRGGEIRSALCDYEMLYYRERRIARSNSVSVVSLARKYVPNPSATHQLSNTGS
jgi:SAM-dependent methyltransferase